MIDTDPINQIALPLDHQEAFTGTPAASGVAFGQAIIMLPHAILDAVPHQTALNIDDEIAQFKLTIESVAQDIQKMTESLHDVLTEEDIKLFQGYQQILTSDHFYDAIINKIKSGIWIQCAISETTLDLIERFSALSDDYLKERARDIADLGKRVLSHIQKQTNKIKSFPSQTILIGPEITASMLAEVTPNKLKGIISINSTINSHMVILAKALNIPVIINVQDIPLDTLHENSLIIDGYAGKIIVSPDDALRTSYRQLIEEESELEQKLQSIKNKPCITKDNYLIPLRANIGMITDINSAKEIRAEGVGLYRTEIPFMVMDRFPSEEEQVALYRQLLTNFPNHPIIMRTLDIGGDKSLEYFPIHEDNPFLGWRGIRLLLDQPELFSTQIRAMLKASIGFSNLHILFPMVSVLDEINEAKIIIRQEFDTLKAIYPELCFPKIGTMIEVPAAVYCAEDFMGVCDFICVGSNDLTQYLMAVDRTNNRVANLYDPFHPAMLKALLHIVNAAKKQNTPVSLCGEMANNPVALLMLIGMGFDSLSLNSHDLLKIKWLLRGLTQAYCRDLLVEALTFKTGKQVYTHFKDAIIQSGFGGLIRAGKK